MRFVYDFRGGKTVDREKVIRAVEDLLDASARTETERD